VAPKWTPESEDLLLQLCSEIGLDDEDVGFGVWAERHFETHPD